MKTNNDIKTVIAAHSLVGQCFTLEFKVSSDEITKTLGKSTLVRVEIEIDKHELIIPALSGTSLTVRLQARFRSKGFLPEKMKLSEIISLGGQKTVKESLPKAALEYIKMYRLMWKKAGGSIEKCRKLTALTLDINDDTSLWEIVKDNCPQT